MYRWMACPKCNELIIFLDQHKCHPEVVKKVEAHVDKLVKGEMEHFEDDVQVFWHSKDVRFMQYLLKEARENGKTDT